MAAEETARARLTPPRQTLKLSSRDCWQLLAGVPLGRVVFVQQALPVIRPVNHLVDGQKIIFRSRAGSAITAHAASDGGGVVSYEADALDPEQRTAWSVIAAGVARLVTDPALVTRYGELLEPWTAGQKDYVIAVEPRSISGIRLVRH